MISSLEPEPKRRKVSHDDASPVLSVITSMNKAVVSFDDSKEDLPSRGSMSPLALDKGPCMDELPKVFENFLQDEEWKDEKEQPIGSLTPRLGQSDPDFLAWIQTQGDTKKKESNETKRTPRFSCEIRKVLNKYLVSFPVVRVRERASMDSKIVSKLYCGSIVEAWEEVVVRPKASSSSSSKSILGDDVIRRNPWVRLKDESGWVLTKSKVRPGTELLHRLGASDYVSNAFEVLKEFIDEKDTGSGSSSSSDTRLLRGVREAMTQIQSSRVMKSVIQYQSRMIEHLKGKLSIYQP